MERVLSPPPVVNESLVDSIAEVAGHLIHSRPSRVRVLEELSAAFESHLEGHRAIPTSTGTAALETALHAGGVGPEDEVLVPVHTCAAVAIATLRLGALPVLVDVDSSLTMDVDSAAERCTAKTRAAVVVHQYGKVADVAALRAVLPERVLLVEDCAQAPGATRNGRWVGITGDFAVFSFCQGKILGAGQGGMVTTPDPELARRVARYANLGADRPPFYLEAGQNYIMTPLTAVVAKHQLDRLGEILEARGRLAARYRRHLVPAGFEEVVSRIPGTQSVHHRAVMVAPFGDPVYAEWVRRLERRKVLFQARHPAPLYKLPFLADLYRDGDRTPLAADPRAAYPKLTSVEDRLVFCYVRPHLDEAAVDGICEAMIEAWEEAR